MQTIYTFSYTPAIATGTNTIGVNWRMAYQQPIMLYKGTSNTIKIVVFATNQRVVNLAGYEIQIQIVDKETEEHYVTRTAVVTNPISGVGTITFTEAELRNLENRFYHIIARLVLPSDGSSVTTSEILYLDDNYGAFLPVQIENAWNYQPTVISTENGAQVINFRSIGETPDSYTNQAGKLVKVNDAETGVDFSNTLSTLTISNLTINDNIIGNTSINLKFGTQSLSLVDNSTDPVHNVGDGGFIFINDDTHTNDGPRFEIWYGEDNKPSDPPGQHSLDIRSAPNSYVEFASNDLKSFMGIDNISPYVQTNWDQYPDRYWRFLPDGELSLPFDGSRITSHGGQISLLMNYSDFRINIIDLDSNLHSTIFDTTGNVYFQGDLLTGGFTPNPTPINSLGSATHPWKDLYLDNLTISNSTITTPNLIIQGNLLPGEDNVFDLGSSTKQWRHLFVANGSIYIDNIKLSNANGKLEIKKVINPGEEDEIEDPEDSDAQEIDRLISGENSLVLTMSGALELNGAPFTGGGGGGNSPVQPYLELTNNPFIIQPAVLGEPVTVTAPISGQGATVEVVISTGPIISTFTITNAGTGYVVGQRYKIWYYQIGSGAVIGSDIIFEIETVGENGEILTVTTPQFTGVYPNNTPGTYSGVSIELYSSVRDEISQGVVLTRGRVQGLYNIVSEQEYDNSSYISPINTEWNSDGWDNLAGVGLRSFTTFRSALGGQVGNNVVGAELVMRDTTTNRYYKFEFTNWGQNNGGSYSYTRTEIIDPNYFVKTDDGNEIDIFVADDGDGAGIGITRGGQQGIYNPYREESWSSSVSPSGTQWNIDGWDNLLDVQTRTYTNFYTAYGNGGLGNKVPGSKAVMYIPETDTYYAIQWLNWTQNANGGGFSYLRYELDTTKLNEGIKFPDGTVLKSAEGVGRVKSTASSGRRIEEVTGSNQVSVTAVNTNYITAVASRSVVGDNRFWVSNSLTNIALIMENPNVYGIIDYATIQFSLDNVTWYSYNGGYSGDPDEIGVSTNASHTYNEGDTIYFKYNTGGAPQVWWDKNDLPGGGANFRGAVIDYHAYTGEGTFIGTIHIVDDSGEEHISHTEVASGSTDSENDDLWLVQNEGTISYRRLDGESKTLKIHWTAKVFYGTEFWD